ncbi:MAG: GH3 auxin-responsive promoter family protein [Pseudomonadota bacterium]|nr:GH3 auxin-responsive promoter family protein [Pseudomonadota bacterium]
MTAPATSPRRWADLPAVARQLPPAPRAEQWLTQLLARNRHCAYLRQFGSPATVEEFRQRVPIRHHDDLADWIDRCMRPGARDVLFAGAPVGCERTGGSTRGPKLIPYSAEGLRDFQRALLPWLAGVVQRFQITGSAYLATSPATRAPEMVGDLPLGLPDGAYLGPEAGAIVHDHLAVPLTVNQFTDVPAWRAQTLAHLRAAHDLELISVWSPTFFLALLRDIPDAAERWPRLKVISCWASGASAPYAAELAHRLPRTHLQPKGLLSTEGVLTVPDANDAPVLTRHGFAEFAQADQLYLADELRAGEYYDVILTSASGLYRYAAGDRVRCTGRTLAGDAVLEFVGRAHLVSDLVGEKLTEPFVARCLSGLKGFTMLIADAEAPGYVLVSEHTPDPAALATVQARLADNPQYAYACRIGQLKPLRACARPDAWARYEQTLLARGTRLADVKPVALRTEPFWLHVFDASAEAVTP